MFFLIFLLAESISLTGWIMDGKLKGHDAIRYLRYGTPEIITNYSSSWSSAWKPSMYKQDGKTAGNRSNENKWNQFRKNSFISNDFFISCKYGRILAKITTL